MISRIFFLLNLDVLFFLLCMWYHHTQSYLILWLACLNTFFWSSIMLFTQINLLCWLAVYCKQTSLNCLNMMKHWIDFLNMYIDMLFYCIRFTSDIYKGKLKLLYLFSKAVKLKYWSSGVRTAPLFHFLLQKVIVSSQSL